MKRIGNLYESICDKDNIRLAIKNASKDHARDKAVIEMKSNPEPYVNAIYDMLTNESFHQSRYNTKIIFEHGKQRTLRYTRTFPDRVIQHCLVQVIGGHLQKTYIHDTYASITGKGLHKGNLRMKEWLEDVNGTRYCLKLDVHHYFESVDRDILMSLLKKKIKCKRTLNLLKTFIYQAPSTGIPIGNYLSQYLSNFYLSYFDHYCKERLGIKYYMRYMDDIVILHGSKTVLRGYLKYITNYLESNLKLKLKPNYQYFPTDSRGIDFLGFVFRHRYTRLRKRVKIAYIRSVNTIISKLNHKIPITAHDMMSLTSYAGFCTWCNAKHLIDVYHNEMEWKLVGGERIN